jgi:hypothetical protein
MLKPCVVRASRDVRGDRRHDQFSLCPASFMAGRRPAGDVCRWVDPFGFVHACAGSPAPVLRAGDSFSLDRDAGNDRREPDDDRE